MPAIRGHVRVNNLDSYFKLRFESFLIQAEYLVIRKCLANYKIQVFKFGILVL